MAAVTDMLSGWLVVFIIMFACWAYYWVRRMRNVFLNGDIQHVELLDKVPLSHDTYKYRFALSSAEQGLGWSPAMHLQVFAPNVQGVSHDMWNGRTDHTSDLDELMRPYSPISGDEAKGYFDLVVKIYRPNDVFVDGGKLSRYWDSLKIGDVAKMRGVPGKIRYLSGGEFHEKGVKVAGGPKRKIGMVAGGTGVTALLQIIRKIVDSSNKWDKREIEISIIVANKSEDDVLCSDVLKEYEAKAGGRLRVWYTIDSSVQQEGTWKYSIGYISTEMLTAHLAAPSTGSSKTAAANVVLLCGPGAMVAMAQKLLFKIGYAKETILVL